MASDVSKITKTEVETKVAEIDGEKAIVQKLPDGSARMVITRDTEENADEE
jgi:hypothetical protein